MPFQSFAQLRKFASLVKQGKISEKTFKEWLSKTNTSNLPEHKDEHTTNKTKKRKS